MMRRNQKNLHYTKILFLLTILVVVLYIIYYRASNDVNDFPHMVIHRPTQKSRMFLQKENDLNRIPICFAIQSFLEHGGVEQWLKTLVESFSKNNEYFFLGGFVSKWTSVSYESFLSEHNLISFNNPLEMCNYCGVIIVTGFWPIKCIPSILAIHGSGEWTNIYAQFSIDHDSVIAVSRYSMINNKTKVIRPIIKIKDCKITVRKHCKRQVLFVGRISSEKRLDVFCDNCLKFGDCCVIVGDASYDIELPECSKDGIHFVGSHDTPSCYMESSEVLLVTSDKEGGPLVAIEMLMMGKPIIMSKTGVQVEFPEKIQGVNWKESSYSDLLESMDKLKDSKYVVQEYSENFVMREWLSILNNLKLIKRPDCKLLGNGISSKTIGMQLQVDCYSMSCEWKLKCDSKSIFNYQSTSEVNLFVKGCVILKKKLFYCESLFELSFKQPAGFTWINFLIR